MVAPDILVPEQCRALQGKVLSAEERLLFAIVEEAVHCFQTYVDAVRARDRQVFRKAEEWFETPKTRWFFSFANICDLVGLDADYVRQGLRGWKVAHTSQGARRALIAWQQILIEATVLSHNLTDGLARTRNRPEDDKEHTNGKSIPKACWV